MADLLSILQGNAASPNQGWASLGAAFAGGNRQDAFTRGTAQAAQLDQLTQTARLRREEAMAAERERERQVGLPDNLIAAGWDPAAARLAGAFSGSGLNPQQYTSARGDTLNQGYQAEAFDAARGNNVPLMNNLLSALEGKPRKTVEMSEGQLFNPYGEVGQSVNVTPVGQSSITQRNAAAGASNAAGQAALGRLGIAREQFAMQRDGLWSPDRNVAGSSAADPSAKATEGERSAAGFLQRMRASQQELDGLQAKGYDPANLRDFYTAGEGPLRNWISSADGQVNRQQQEDWVRAKLRKESGAVIGAEEMDREIKTYFPQPGDNPAVLQSKGRSRDRALDQMRIVAGRAAGLADSSGGAQANRGAAQGSAAAAFGGAAPQAQRARNPATGQVLVLRNGQWVPE